MLEACAREEQTESRLLLLRPLEDPISASIMSRCAQGGLRTGGANVLTVARVSGSPLEEPTSVRAAMVAF
ncbi:hypothetical protein MRX96_051388 [Rhipicephalus microplus]